MSKGDAREMQEELDRWARLHGERALTADERRQWFAAVERAVPAAPRVLDVIIRAALKHTDYWTLWHRLNMLEARPRWSSRVEREHRDRWRSEAADAQRRLDAYVDAVGSVLADPTATAEYKQLRSNTLVTSEALRCHQAALEAAERWGPRALTSNRREAVRWLRTTLDDWPWRRLAELVLASNGMAVANTLIEPPCPMFVAERELAQSGDLESWLRKIVTDRRV